MNSPAEERFILESSLGALRRETERLKERLTFWVLTLGILCLILGSLSYSSWQENLNLRDRVKTPEETKALLAWENVSPQERAKAIEEVEAENELISLGR